MIHIGGVIGWTNLDWFGFGLGTEGGGLFVSHLRLYMGFGLAVERWGWSDAGCFPVRLARWGLWQFNNWNSGEVVLTSRGGHGPG